MMAITPLFDINTSLTRISLNVFYTMKLLLLAFLTATTDAFTVVVCIPSLGADFNDGMGTPIQAWSLRPQRSRLLGRA
ncbi:hypothetical protein WAI453_012913 [Rhynchosporium graminicola]